MKLKIITMTSIILLLLLTLGSVYSTEDISDNSTDECLGNSETDVEDPEFVKMDDYTYIIDEYTIGKDDEYERIFEIQFNKSYDTKGNITVEIDNEICYNNSLNDNIFEYDDFEMTEPVYLFSIYKKTINKELSYGPHNLLVKHIQDSNEKILINATFHAIYYFVAYDNYIHYGDESKIVVRLPEDATGTLSITYNGKTKNMNYKNGRGEQIISSKELKLGDNKVTVKLTGDKKYPNLITYTRITMDPKFTTEEIPYYCVSIGEKDYITVNVPKSYSGTFKIYSTYPKEEYDSYEHSYYTAYYKNKLIASAKVVNGVGKITTSKFSKGEHKLILEFKSGKYTCTSYYLDLKIAKNNPKIKVSLSSKDIYDDQKVKITVKSPKTSTIEHDMVMVIDGKSKYLTLKNGKATKYLSKLKSGTHTLKLYMYDYKKNLFFSKTFKIKVKDKINIKAKNLVIKKSTKKYTVKATLKIKGKLAKSKKVSFKINGKTLKAKTNKKGIAKITLKKSVLKKLPVGKKIKYTVTYGKKVVSKTLLIK